MRVVLAFLVMIAVVIIVSGFVIWSATTNFGKEHGLYITQETEVARLSDSTYYIQTYVWYNPSWYNFKRKSIEYSAFDNVKCYDVKRVEAEQYKAADSVYQRIKKYLKETGGKYCKP